MELSRFFTLDEMTRSATAQSEGIPNDPGAAEIENLRALCNAVLDPLRESIGRPIRVTSGFRGPALNRRIGGASNSQHVTGEAADIDSRGLSVLELFQRIIRLELPFDQVIYEDKSAAVKWVHVSHASGRGRGQILRARFAPGRPATYLAMTAEEALALSEPGTRTRGGALLAPVEMADEPGASGRKPRRRKKAAKRATAGRRKPGKRPKARKTQGAKARGKPAKRTRVMRGGGKRRAAKTARKKTRRSK